MHNMQLHRICPALNAQPCQGQWNAAVLDQSGVVHEKYGTWAGNLGYLCHIDIPCTKECTIQHGVTVQIHVKYDS